MLTTTAGHLGATTPGNHTGIEAANPRRELP